MTRSGITKTPSQEELIGAEAELLAIMNRHPGLTAYGFGPARRPGEEGHSLWGHFAASHVVKQFILAKRYISQHRGTHSRTGRSDSGALKHSAERFYASIGLDNTDREWHPYISNGAFIAAAYALGVRVWRDKQGHNANIGIFPYKGYLDAPDTIGR